MLYSNYNKHLTQENCDSHTGATCRLIVAVFVLYEFQN